MRTPKLNSQTHAVIQIALFGCQFLFPAFVPMNHEQQVAVAGFISAVQGYLVYGAVHTMPDGTPIQSTTKGNN